MRRLDASGLSQPSQPSARPQATTRAASGSERRQRLWRPQRQSEAVHSGVVPAGAGGPATSQDCLQRRQAVRTQVQEPCVPVEPVPDPAGSASVPEDEHNADSGLAPPMEDPEGFMRQLMSAPTIPELYELVTQHTRRFNFMHTTGALVRLARLVSAAADAQQAAMAGPHQRVHRRRVVKPNTDTRTASLKRAQLIPDHQTAVRLGHKLCMKYVSQAGYMTREARPHANVCWALGLLCQDTKLKVPERVLHIMVSVLTDNGAILLQEARSQELVQLAVGLVKQGHVKYALLKAVCWQAGHQIEHFKPQELANLGWAAAVAYSAVNCGPRGSRQHRGRTSVRHSASASNSCDSGWNVGSMGDLDAPERKGAWSLGWDESGGDSPEDIYVRQQLAQQYAAVVDRVACAAAEKAHQFKPGELSYLLWACATADLEPRKAFPLFRAAIPVLEHAAFSGALTPLDVSNCTWAYAQLQIVGLGHQLFDAVAGTLLAPLSPAQQRVLQAAGSHKPQCVLHTCDDQELCTILWAAGALRYRDQGQTGGVVAALMAEAVVRAPSLQARGLAMTLWASARLDLCDTRTRCELLLTAARVIGSAEDTNPAQHAANVLWACASLPPAVCRTPAIRAALSRLAAVARASLSSALPTALAQYSWAAGWAARACEAVGGRAAMSEDEHVLLPPTPTTDPAQVHAVSLPDAQSASPAASGGDPGAELGPAVPQGFTSGSATLSMWYAATWQPLVSEVTDVAFTRLPTFEAEDLSVLAQGLSHAQRREADRQLFESVGDLAVSRLAAGEFTPGGLAALLAAYVRAGVPHLQLTEAAAQTATRSMTQYRPTELANLMWALACLRVRHRPLLEQASHMLLLGPLAHVASSPTPPRSPTPPPVAHRHAPQGHDDSTVPAHAPPGQPAVGGVVAGRSPSYDEEEAPRSSAASLLRQLGWDSEEAEGSPGLVSAEGDTQSSADQELDTTRGQRKQTRRGWDVHALPWAQQAALQAGGRARRMDAVVLAGLYPEPTRSSPAMVWTVIAWAFARGGYHQYQLFDRLAAAVLSGPLSTDAPAPSSDAPGVANSSGEDAGGQGEGGPAAAGVDALDVPGAAHLACLRTPAVVQLLWSFATVDHVHPGLLGAAAPVLAARILRGELSTREVGTVAWTYAKLQHYEPILFRAILQEAMTHASRYGLRDWSRLAWAFSTLCLPSEEAFFVRLGQLQRQHAAAQAQRQASTRPDADGVGPHDSSFARTYSAASASGSGARVASGYRTGTRGAGEEQDWMGRQRRAVAETAAWGLGERPRGAAVGSDVWHAQSTSRVSLALGSQGKPAARAVGAQGMHAPAP